MLASDLIMDVRASRTISADQMERLEKMVFGNGRPSGDQLDLLYLMDTYLQRPDPRWAELLARAAMTALPDEGAGRDKPGGGDLIKRRQVSIGRKSASAD